MKFIKAKKERLGPVAQKILLLLGTGVALYLTNRPDYFFKIIKSSKKEWDKISQRSLREAIRRLYRSNLIDYKENNDSTISMVLSKEGKSKALKYDLNKIRVKKSNKWDGLWRIVIFDIPENKKKARDALSKKIKFIGLKPLQKSVFVSPYECRNEIDFISEIFEVKPYVRYIVAKEIDTALDLKKKFDLV